MHWSDRPRPEGSTSLQVAHRNLRLSTDAILGRLERLWVAMAGGLRRRREGRRLDPRTGRTGLDHLKERGLGPEVWPLVEEALDRGVPSDELAEALSGATSRAARQVAEELSRRAPQMLREHRAIRRGTHRRLRAIWGPALDAFYEVYVCAEEVGSELQQLHGEAGDHLAHALVALQARASLVMLEVHSLIEAGHPMGAWARTRSLHETAVIGVVLSKFGREEGFEDLGERYLEHGVVDQARDVHLAVQGGIEIDPEIIAAVDNERTRVIARFGAGFGKDYGWARPLFPSQPAKSRVTFRDLEEIAESGLDRFDYRMGGHHVHSSSWTLALNALERGGSVVRLTGPTNVGFAEPATVALTALAVCTQAVVEGVSDELPDPMHLVAARTLYVLGERAARLFVAAQAVVDEREGRIQRRLAPGP